VAANSSGVARERTITSLPKRASLISLCIGPQNVSLRSLAVSPNPNHAGRRQGSAPPDVGLWTLDSAGRTLDFRLETLDFRRRRSVGIDGPPEPQPARIYPALNVWCLPFGCNCLLFDWHNRFH